METVHHFVSGQRKGSQKLALKGYFYYKSRDLVNGSTSYRCEESRTRLSCKGSGILFNNIFTEGTQHSHAGDFDEVNAETVRRKIYDSVLTSESKPRVLISKGVNKTLPHIQSKLPSNQSMWKICNEIPTVPRLHTIG
uniref:FLYWCH-type domain-containing protein n=1 Tax=Rhabditophanes sp. KR3021 TaxID=114890 RepID=A0AC35TRF5_9BILA